MTNKKFYIFSGVSGFVIGIVFTIMTFSIFDVKTSNVLPELNQDQTIEIFSKIGYAHDLVNLDDPYDYFPDIPLCSELQIFIGEMAERYEIDKFLILAIAHVETGGTYNTELVGGPSDKGVYFYGLMQIDPGWLSWGKERNDGRKLYLMDPYDNIQLGTMILKYYQDMAHVGTDLHKLAMCYNGNEGYARELWDKGIFETKYSRAVVDIYNKLKN